MTVTFNQKRQRWMFDFERGGKRYAGTCRGDNGLPCTSKRAALEAEAREKLRAAAEPKAARASDLTIAKVIVDLRPAWTARKDWPSIQVYAREIVAYFKPDRTIASISEADIENYITWALKQPVMVWTGGRARRRDDPDAAQFWRPSGRTRSPGTINRYLPTLRAIFDRAFKTRDSVTRERAIDEKPKIKMLKVGKRKARPVPESVLDHITRHLPQHVAEALTATRCFGFRRSEIYRLEIADVDFEKGGVWLSHDAVKDDEDAFTPGSPDAMAFMRGLVDQANARNVTRLISYRAKPDDPWRAIESPKTAWRTVMDIAQAAFGRRWRWHDIRAAYISGVANDAGPLAAQRLARHSDYRTTQAYVAVESPLLRSAAQGAGARALAAIGGGKIAGRERRHGG